MKAIEIIKKAMEQGFNISSVELLYFDGLADFKIEEISKYKESFEQDAIGAWHYNNAEEYNNANPEDPAELAENTIFPMLEIQIYSEGYKFDNSGERWAYELYRMSDDEIQAKKIKKYIEKAEALGWNVKIFEEEVEFSKFSPAGEDFSFTVSKNNISEEVYEYYENFDVDEHIELWIEAKRTGVRDVPSIKVLCEDAEEIDNMLHLLAEELINLD